MIEQSLFSVLSSALPGARIYPLTLPLEPILPALTYSVIGATASPTLNTSGLTRYRVEISCYGQTYFDAATLRSQLKAALNGYQDHNMTVNWTSNTDYFLHEALQYRCCAEFHILSVL